MRWLPILCTVLAIGVGSAIVGVYLWLDELQVFSLADEKLSNIISYKPPDNTIILDRNGIKIGELFDNYHVFVPFDKIPKKMVDAIIAIEDRSFFNHSGFDPKGILRAIGSRVFGYGPKQGASTITQQVVRNFILSRDRTVERKVQEIFLAIQLEKKLSKQKIFEIYANALFLGHGSYGIGAAAFRYFGRPLDKLQTQEFALIAGLFQSPSRYNPIKYPKLAKNRQKTVIKAMTNAKFITPKDAKSLLSKKLVYAEYKPLNSEMAPYFVDFIKEEAQKTLPWAKVNNRGLRIHTTLDYQIQKIAEKSFADSHKLFETASQRTAMITLPNGKKSRATLEGALLSVDPSSGEILAMVGGRDYNKSQFNRTYQSMRSPGSSFKPIVYSQALKQNYKWSDVIFVSPITIKNYRPHTPDEDFLTETTLLRAFYRSMNTPTVELGEKIGLKPVIQNAVNLGIRSPIKEEFGSMLGSSDVTMFDLARVYSSFANLGRLTEIIGISRVTDRDGNELYKAPPSSQRSKEVISPQIAYLMTQGMRAVLSMGTGFTSSHLSTIAAGKTGTSNNATDNWFCGYTTNLTTIVWVGTDEHAEIFGDTTGGKISLPIWDKFVSKVIEVRPPNPFPSPPGIVAAAIHPKFGNRSPQGVRMYFVRGQEPPDGGSALEEISNTSQTGGYRDVFNH